MLLAQPPSVCPSLARAAEAECSTPDSGGSVEAARASVLSNPGCCLPLLPRALHPPAAAREPGKEPGVRREWREGRAEARPVGGGLTGRGPARIGPGFGAPGCAWAALLGAEPTGRRRPERPSRLGLSWEPRPSRGGEVGLVRCPSWHREKGH